MSKVLIVDDSVVFRTAISQALENVEGLEIFKAVSNGKIAIDFLKANSDISLITLDMEMPVMDGLETIKEIRKFDKDVKIIVFSSQTVRGAEKTIDALSSGANDFVPKTENEGTIEKSIEMIRESLVPKIEAILSNPVSRNVAAKKLETFYDSEDSVIELDQALDKVLIKPKLIVIGCSTGGPDALTKLFSSLTGKISIPILIVQHMPPVFTTKLASMLNKLSEVTVKEAEVGDRLSPGVCYLAPGDYHMFLKKDLTIGLNQEEKVCYVRPAVDVMFNSVANSFKGQVLSIVLTGMGEDGTDGCTTLSKYGAYQFIQDEESSIVWGMPGSVHSRKLGATVVHLDSFGQLISKISERL